MTKSCQTPRTSGVFHTSRSPLWLTWISSPSMSNSSGGDPQQPLWCHWVKTCQVLLLGNVDGKNVLHAYQYSSPSTNGMFPSSSSLREPLDTQPLSCYYSAGEFAGGDPSAS